MQHTDKYNFRIIEDTDTFSPDALNGNTRDFEKQLTALEDADAALAQSTANADAALQATAAADKTELLTAIGSGGKTCRIACGNYKGTGNTGAGNALSVTVDFKPLVLFVTPDSGVQSFIMLRPCGIATNTSFDGIVNTVIWEDRKVSWYTVTSPVSMMNLAGNTYHYVVLGESD